MVQLKLFKYSTWFSVIFFCAIFFVLHENMVLGLMVPLLIASAAFNVAIASMFVWVACCIRKEWFLYIHLPLAILLVMFSCSTTWLTIGVICHECELKPGIGNFQHKMLHVQNWFVQHRHSVDTHTHFLTGWFN